MSGKHIVRKDIYLNAKPGEVWKALTTPELTKKYFFGCEVFSGWKPGDEIKFKRKFLWMKIEMKGKILKAEPEKLLQYTLKNSSAKNDPAEESESLVTDQITYTDGQTHLKITDDVGMGKGFEKRFKKSEKGWEKILKGLKKVVEDK